MEPEPRRVFPIGRGHHKKPKASGEVRYCERCGCRLNSYNTGAYCAPCRESRRLQRVREL